MGSFAVKDVPVLCSVLSQKSRDRARPTTMYFERWGLLVPPLRKADFLKDMSVSLLFPYRYYTPTMRSVQDRRAGVLACKKLLYTATIISSDHSSWSSLCEDVAWMSIA